MSKSERFWDKTAEKYAASPIRDEETYKKKLEKTQEYFTPDMDVMEFGCGTGTTAIHHAPHVKSYLATDISGNMVEIGRAKAKEEGIENLKFEKATLDSMTYPPESFDVILGLNIVHLIRDIDSGLARIHEMLKPGGLFIHSTAILSDSRLWFLKPVLPLGTLLGFIPFVKFYNKEKLTNLIEAAGFETVFEWQANNNFILFSVARKKGTVPT